MLFVVTLIRPKQDEAQVCSFHLTRTLQELSVITAVEKQTALPQRLHDQRMSLLSSEEHMNNLSTYEGFIAQVDELGFLPLSHLMEGLPSISDFVDRSQWHTGDEQTDPWLWKDRAAAEKRLAYGCILNGHKGFVAGRLYGWFYAAYHPIDPMPERWAAGLVSQPVWRLWQLFERKTLLNTAEVRAEMGGSRVDASLKELQRQYFLTVAGVRQKIAQQRQALRLARRGLRPPRALVPARLAGGCAQS